MLGDVGIRERNDVIVLGSRSDRIGLECAGQVGEPLVFGTELLLVRGTASCGGRGVVLSGRIEEVRVRDVNAVR